MANISGGIPFAGLVSPTDSSDTYAVTDEQYNRGGFRTVADLSARNSITVDRQLQGMLVYVQSENKTYQLNGTAGSNLWEEYKSSGNVMAETLSGSSLNASIESASGITSVGSSGKNLQVNSDTITAHDVVVTGSTVLNSGISGIIKAISGIISSASEGDDYLSPIGDGSHLSGITPSQIGITFGNISRGSDKVSLTGQVSGAVVGTGLSIDVNEQNIMHNSLSGLTSGNPHTQYQLLSEKAQSLGYASLDGGGKVPLSQLPSTLLQYEGQWNASSNSPHLINPDMSKVSNVYEVSVAGNTFSIDWMVGDWLVYNSSGVVEKSINSNIVASVFGRTGAVTSQFGDYNKSQVSGLTDSDEVTFNSETLNNLNTNTAIYSDGNRKIQSSAVTKAQLEYLSGVTSDVQVQIDSKVSGNTLISSGTHTKISYDSKGLVTSGVDATTNDISDYTDKRYVTDYQKSVLQNTSGVNTGDETLSSLENKLNINSVNLNSLQNLSGINTGDETNSTIKTKLGISSSSSDGYLSSSDWNTFNNKISGVITDNSLSGNGRPGNALKVEPLNVNHNSLGSVQGGTSSERYHLTNAQYVITTQTASASLSGILSSTDWSTFNNKQNALTNPITGTGTSGQLAVFNGTTSVSGVPATTQSISASINRQYVTDNELSGLTNSVNAITGSNPVADKKYTDDSISGVTFWNRSSSMLSPKYVGDSVNLLSGGIRDNNSSGVIFLDDVNNTYLSTYNKTIVGGINELKNITSITKDPSGFVDPTAVTVSYDSTTRKITLTGSFEFYYKGVNVVQIDPTFVSGWVSSAHTDVTDYVYYLYFNGTSFIWTNSFPGFYYPLVATVIYRSNAKFASRECHSFMPWQTHEELHKTIGTYKDSGGTLSNFTLSSTTAVNRRPYISECIIRDEDCPTVNAALTTTNYSLRYISSANTINFTVDSIDIVSLSGNNPYYNSYNGSTWQQTLMPANSVASVWLFALPATADTASQKYRFFFEQPQWISQAQNSSPSALASAITAELSYNIGNLSIGDPSALASEYIGIARVIIQYTDGNWTIQNVSYLTGSKYVQSTSTGSFLTSVTTEPTNLTGNGTVSYPLNTIQNIAPSSSPTFTGITISGAVTTNSLKVDSLSGVVSASNGNISASPLSTVLASVSGLPNGLATLNASGVLSASQVPSNIDALYLNGAQLSTDGTFASNSDSLIPSQKATNTYSKSLAIKYALILG